MRGNIRPKANIQSIKHCNIYFVNVMYMVFVNIDTNTHIVFKIILISSSQIGYQDLSGSNVTPEWIIFWITALLDPIHQSPNNLCR